MNWKLVITISSVAAYAILIVVYIYFTKNWKDFTCDNTYKFRCLRVCTKDTEKYSDEFLIATFKKLRWFEEKVKVVYGEPKCGLRKNGFFINDTAQGMPELYDDLSQETILNIWQYRYCMDRADDGRDGWILRDCFYDAFARKFFHISVFVISSILVIATIGIYASFSELRDVRGKIVIALMVSYLFILIIIPIILYTDISYTTERWLQSIMIVYGCGMSFLWMSVMTLKSFLRFVSFKQHRAEKDHFGVYLAVVTIFTTIAWLVFMQSHTRSFLPFISKLEPFIALTYFFIAVIAGFLILATIVLMFRVSRRLEHLEHVKYEREKKWFFINIKLIIILVITWPVECFHDAYIPFNLIAVLAYDILKLLSTFLIFAILVLRKDVRMLLFEKYRVLQN